MSGNNVDWSQRTAPQFDGDDMKWAIDAMKRARPDWHVWGDHVKEKLLHDWLDFSVAGKENDPGKEAEEIARVRQAQPEDENGQTPGVSPWGERIDPFTAQMHPKWYYETPPVLRWLRSAQPYWAVWNSPEEMDKLAEGYGGKKRIAKEKPLESDENGISGDPLSPENVEKWNRSRRKL